MCPSTLFEGGGGALLYHPQCVSLYLGWRWALYLGWKWGRGSFVSSTVRLPLPWVKVGEELICIIHSVSPSTLCEGGGGAHLYHPQCVSLYLVWRWGRDSFVSSTVCLPLPWVKGVMAHLYHTQCVSLYLGWRWGRGSFVSSIVCLPLPCLKVGEGLFCIIHSVSPSTFGEGGPSTLGEGGEGLICIIHSASPSTLCEGGGGAHLYHPQCVSLYLVWMWGRGSFVSSTVCLPLPWVKVGEGLICIIHSVSPSTLCEGGGGAHLYHPQCVSLYLGWRWGRGSFVSSTVCLPLPWAKVGEGLFCIIHSVSHSTLSEGGGEAHLYHPQCVSLYLVLRWGRGSFVSSTVCLPLPWVKVGPLPWVKLGEGFICIIPPSTLCEGGGGAHLYHPQCVSLYLGWRWGRGSFVSSTVRLPLPCVKVGEGLICIIHSVSPSTLCEGGGGAHLYHPQCVSLYFVWRWGRDSFVSSTVCLPLPWVKGGGAHLYHPQCVSLYLGWRWGRGSFVSSTVRLPLPCVKVGEGLICIIHSVSPSTLCEGGGGAHLYHPQCVSLYFVWRWGRDSFVSSTVCLPLPWVKGGGAHLYHPQCVSLYLGWRWGRGSFVSSTVCLPLPLVKVGPLPWVKGGRGSFVSSRVRLPLPCVKVGEGLICIIHSVSPSTLGEGGGGAHLYHPQCVSLYLGRRWGRGYFVSSTVSLILPWVKVEERLICIIHSVSPSTLFEGGGGALLYHPQCVSLYLGWRWALYLGWRWGRSSFVSSLPLPCVMVGEGLICIIHSVSPSNLGEGGGGAHLYHPQCVSLYLVWRWGRGSFVSSTVCLPLPCVKVGEGLICIIHSASPSTFCEGGGGTHLYHPQCVYLYLGWRGKGLICTIHMYLSLPWVKVGEGLFCIIHSVSPSTLFEGGGGALLYHPQCVSLYLWWRWALYLGWRGGGAHLYHPECVSLYLVWRWGRGSFVSSTVCLPLPCVKVGEGLICIIHSVSPSTLGEGGRGSHLYHPQCVSLYLVWRWGRGSFVSSTVCLPLHCVKVGEGLICIIHSVSPSTLGEGGGGALLYHPQCLSLYLEWRWRRGSFVSSTVCLPLPCLKEGEGLIVSSTVCLPLPWVKVGPLPWVKVGEGLICIIPPSTLCEGGGGAHLYHPQCVSLYLGWRWGRGSFVSSTVRLPLPCVKVGEGLICIIHCVSPSTLCEGGGEALLYHPQCVSLYLVWRWGRGSFVSSTVCLPLPWVKVGPLPWVKAGEGLICIIHSVSPYTLCEDGGGALLYHPQCVSLYLVWRWGRDSFVSSTVRLPLSTLGEGGEGAPLYHPQCVSLYLGWRWGRGSFVSSTVVSPSTLGEGGVGALLYLPQCLSLYLEWRWRRGSFVSSTVCLPLPCLKVGEGLFCIIHSVSPSTLGEGGGGALLYHPQCLSLYLEWRWRRGSFVSSTVCLPLPCLKVGEGLFCIIHSVSPSTLGESGPSTLGEGEGGAHLYHPSLYLVWRWGRGSFVSSTVCLLLPWVKVGEGLICIIHSASPSTLCEGGGGANLYHPLCVSLYLVWRRGRGSFVSSTVRLPLPCVKVGEGLICIIHSVSPSTLGEGGPSTLGEGGGGAHLYHPQCVSLYLVWRWGRGSFVSSTVRLPLPCVKVGELFICIIHSVSPSTLGEGGGGANLYHPQCVSLYLGWRWGRGSFVSSTVCLPLPCLKVGEGLVCIIHSMSPSTLGEGGGGAHLYHPQCISLYLGWRWGRGSFVSSTVCLPLPCVKVGEGLFCINHSVSPSTCVKVGEGLFCIIHSVSPSTLGEGGGGAHLYHPQCVSIYLVWRRGRGSFVSSTVCLPLPWVKVGEGLICIIHSASPSTLGEGGGGALLYHPQCVSLYLVWRWGRGSFVSITVCLPLLVWRWGRGSFVSSTVCLPLPWVKVGEGLICIIHSVSPSTLSEGGGEAHLYHPQCVSLYLVWRWGRGSFVSSTVCLPLPWVKVGEGLICIIHSVSPSTLGEGGPSTLGEGGPSTFVEGGGGAHLYHPQCVSLYLVWRWGRGSFVSSTVCLLLSRLKVGERLFCIIHSVSPSTLCEGGGWAHLYHPQCFSLYLVWRWRRGSFVSSTVRLPLPWVKVGEGLFCIIHSVSPSILGEGGPSTLGEGGGGAHLYNPQYVSLYLVWRWGRGSFVSSTVRLPLPCVKVGEGLICIIHSASPSTLGEGGRGAHLYHPQCVSLFLGWRWGRGSFVSSTVCLPLPWVKVGPLPWVKVGEELICIIHSVSPSTLGEGGEGAHLYHPQCVSLYLGWRWGRGSFVSSTVCLPLPCVKVGERLFCIIHSVSPSTLGEGGPSTLGEGGGGAHLYHPQCVSLYLVWRWGRGSFVSSTVWLPLPCVKVGEGLICIFQSVSPSTLCEGGGGALLYHPQCVSLYLGWRWGRGSFVSSTVCLPLPWVNVGPLHWVKVGEGLICIIHSVSPSTLCEDGGGALLYHPQCVSLYLVWRWGRGSFVSSTVRLPLPCVKVGEGLICIIHSVSPSTLGEGGGGALLYHPQCVSLYLGWRWGRSSFVSSTVCLPLPWVKVGEGLICIIHSVSPSTLGEGGPSTLGEGGGGAHLYHPQCVSLYLGWRWGRGSYVSSTVSLTLPCVKVGERLICIIHSVSPSTLCEGGGGALLYHPQCVSLYLVWRWGRGSFVSSTVCLPIQISPSTQSRMIQMSSPQGVGAHLHVRCVSPTTLVECGGGAHCNIHSVPPGGKCLQCNVPHGFWDFPN